MNNPNFDLDVKFKDGTVAQQHYSFSDEKDKVSIGGFDLIKDESGKWTLNFSLEDDNLKNAAKAIALPHEINMTTRQIKIPLSTVKIADNGNIEFELESTKDRATAKTRKFTITPNSIKTSSTEIAIAPAGKVLDVSLPKNFPQLFLGKETTSSISSGLPLEFFQPLMNKDNASFFELSEENHHIISNDTSPANKVELLKVDDNIYTVVNSKMLKVESAFHINQPDSHHKIGFIFKKGSEKIARTIDNVNDIEDANTAMFAGVTPEDWADTKKYLYDDSTLSTQGLTEKEFQKTNKRQAKNITSDGIAPLEGAEPIPETPAPSPDATPDSTPDVTPDSTSEQAPESETEPTQEAEAETEAEVSPESAEAEAETEAETETEATPETENEVESVEYLESENEPPTPASIIEQKDGHWYIDGVDTGYPYQGENGKNGSQPKIGLTRKWEINGEETPFVAMTPDGKTGITPKLNAEGKWEIDGKVFDKKIEGQEGQIAPIPSISDDGHWVINGEDSGLDARDNKLKIVDGEWKIDDGTDLGAEIEDLNNKSSVGEKGKDGVSPTINENGNWVLDDEDTSIKSAPEEQHKEDVDLKDFKFAPSPLFYIGGIFLSILGILTGMIGLLAFGVLLMATPKTTEAIVKDRNSSKLRKAKSELKSKAKNFIKEKAQNFSIIKNRYRNLKLAHEILRDKSKEIKLDKNWKKSMNFFYDRKSLTKEAKTAIKKMNFDSIPSEKIEKHKEKIKETKNYLIALKSELESKKSSFNAETKAELLPKIKDALAKVEKAQDINFDMFSKFQMGKALQSEVSFTSEINPEKVVASMTSFGATPDTIFSSSTFEDFTEEMQNLIESSYDNYVDEIKTYLDKDGEFETSMRDIYETLDAHGESNKRIDYELDQSDLFEPKI